MNHPNPHGNNEPSSSAANDHDDDILPTIILADILEDPNTKWSDIRAALKAVGRGSFVDSGGKQMVAATTNAGMLSTLMMTRRGRRRGGGDPSKDGERTASSHPEENHNARGGEEEIKCPGEEEDANSSFEAALAASQSDQKGRCKSRRLSTRGGLFKSSLKFVVEDAEAEMNEMVKRLSEDANDKNVSNSMKSKSEFSDSVNIMDFGVDPRRPSFLVCLDSSVSSRSSVDSGDEDVFLPWRRDASPSSSLTSGPNHHPRRGSNNDGALKTSTLSSNPRDPSLSNLVDSVGILDWGESARVGVSSADLDGGSATIANGGGEKDPRKRNDDVADGPSQAESGEIWRIEDYEGSNDHIKGSGPGYKSFAKMLSFRMPAVKSQRPTVADAPGDDTIKHILLKQRRLTVNELSSASSRARENAGADDRRKSAFAPFFGKSRKGCDVSTSSETVDTYSPSPSIHLNREDGVDIGELRRELNDAMRDLRKGRGS
ncbi:hypothetical protein ACHAW5_009803 [Stephanodiscus triporus]|uniref:Uncharacterized protein n=1 Tax=Stephanodiscus triporus TaxID=2934178 RepID=A0ABD3NEZ1_9STRA